MAKTYYIDTEFDKMDLDYVHNYLSEKAYWSKGRSRESVVQSMKNSICFGVFTSDNKQVGFARLLTDFVVFGWIMDVFIDDSFQGKGIGQTLMQTILEYPGLDKVNGIGLRTYDAHGLYQKFGFKQIEETDTWMLRKKRGKR